MLVHSVYFWLKSDLNDTQRADFKRGVESLAKITSVQHFWAGRPAATGKRAAIDDSYSYALTAVFKDVAGHDAYQVDPIHLAFVDACKTYWERVQIYDAA